MGLYPQLVVFRGGFSLHRSPLHAAAYSEKVDGLQLVLDQGAEVNAVDGSGRSALMVAADRGQSMAVGKTSARPLLLSSTSLH